MRRVILLSGGIDSAVCLAMFRGEDRFAVAFDYGQPHRIELGFAKTQAATERVPFKKIHIHVNLPSSGDELCPVFDCRNALFATYGAAYASTIEASEIVIGSNASDAPRFPDCRRDFWSKMRQAFQTGGYSVGISTPLIHRTKAQVVAKARELGVRLEETWSCYQPNGPEPCGLCLACETRHDAMERSNVLD